MEKITEILIAEFSGIIIFKICKQMLERRDVS